MFSSKVMFLSCESFLFALIPTTFSFLDHCWWHAVGVSEGSYIRSMKRISLICFINPQSGLKINQPQALFFFLKKKSCVFLCITTSGAVVLVSIKVQNNHFVTSTVIWHGCEGMYSSCFIKCRGTPASPFPGENYGQKSNLFRFKPPRINFSSSESLALTEDILGKGCIIN